MQLWRSNAINKDTNAAKKLDALDIVEKLIEVPIQSPHLAFGIIVWTYVAWIILAL
tara:strand:- start:20 stop:187 length:168 start_codon:yes stop_codon:yes gene_type:complete